MFFEPGEDHWHGTAPNRFMTHLAIVEVDDEGNSATWGEHVSDEEYGATHRPVTKSIPAGPRGQRCSKESRPRPTNI